MHPDVAPMERSKIYDTMRLFAQREGKHSLAIRLDALSKLSWAIGLHKQGRLSKGESGLNEAFRDTLQKMLRKAGREDLTDARHQIVQEAASPPSETDLAATARRIDEVLGAPLSR